MKKNQYNIKTYFIEEFVEFCAKLDKIPEQEVKLRHFENYILKSRNENSLYLTVVYYLEKILFGEGSEASFLTIPKNSDEEYEKLNLQQLRYSASLINTYSEIESNVSQFIYEFSSNEVQKFLIYYYTGRNMTGIRHQSLVELYEQYNLGKDIAEISLSDFAYEAIKYVPVKRDKSIKLPAVLFREKEINRFYLYKEEDKFVTNLPDEEVLKQIFINYKRIAIIGNVVGKTWNVYLCTTKPRLTKNLIKQGRYTLQTGLKYLTNDFARVKNTISKFTEDYTNFEVELVKAKGALFWDLDSVLDELVERPYGILFARNEVIELEKVVLSKQVISDINYPRNKVTCKYITTDGFDTHKLRDFRNKDISIGDQICEIRFGEYKYINMKVV